MVGYCGCRDWYLDNLFNAIKSLSVSYPRSTKSDQKKKKKKKKKEKKKKNCHKSLSKHWLLWHLYMSVITKLCHKVYALLNMSNNHKSHGIINHSPHGTLICPVTAHSDWEVPHTVVTSTKYLIVLRWLVLFGAMILVLGRS